MKKQILRLGMLIVLLVTTTISCEKKTETTAVDNDAATVETAAVDKGKIKAEIEALEAEYAKALNAGDAEAVADYYSDDAVSYGQNEKPSSGRAAIVETIKGDIAENKGMTVGFTTNEVYVSNDGNQVVELGAYKAVDATNASKYTGNYMALFEKRDGKYICVRDMSASDMPKEK
jgi:uncharacterized protein (TIGR02246 family)